MSCLVYFIGKREGNWGNLGNWGNSGKGIEFMRRGNITLLSFAYATLRGNMVLRGRRPIELV